MAPLFKELNNYFMPSLAFPIDIQRANKIATCRLVSELFNCLELNGNV